jgi:hypothetical protein
VRKPETGKLPHRLCISIWIKYDDRNDGQAIYADFAVKYELLFLSLLQRARAKRKRAARLRAKLIENAESGANSASSNIIGIND